MELKNKQLLCFTALFVLLAFAGCSVNNETNTSLYENSTIILERSEMFTMEEFAIQKITIDKNGLLYETFYPNNTLSKSAYTAFESGEYEALIEVMKNSKFESLDEKQVSDVLVADVGKGVITIKNDFETKTVEINPYINDGYNRYVSNIMAKIEELISNANSPFKFTVSLKYTGVQCQEELWEKWYAEGNINYFAEPTQKQLITDYYASKKIEIISVEEKTSENMVCEACDVCPKSKYYVIEVNTYDRDFLIENGWGEFLE